MTPSDDKTIPDFFDERRMDPVAVATGGRIPKAAIPKKKVGFYVSEALLDRFNRKFHQLKLDGVPVENKSMLAEMAISFALDDMDRGAASHLLANEENLERAAETFTLNRLTSPNPSRMISGTSSSRETTLEGIPATGPPSMTASSRAPKWS
jgi:hypothetical protein